MLVTFDKYFLMNHRGPLIKEDEMKDILEEAECHSMWDEPSTGDRIYGVAKIPRDAPLFGLKWVTAHN